ncbi:selection and upkeep of intraepithelial T-cells protein 7-like [Phyllostomus hastatus]|uniref:selection and upkeep of intraepithelial T-cells protein 7-like n=1 Tax=Phyllostomus hastatus TaxID=9423 RepID=UPI001E6848C3|nr:selection and upkeep of intraepithelial T-cells protein 7-like [Phyllostomus hastatus]
MMTPKYSYFSGYYVGFLFLQVMTSTPEKWTVITPMGHLVATVGGQAELSCQLSPPQSAEHMEVSWFQGNHSKLVHLYRDGHEVNGNAALEYADRIEFVKEAIGDGKVTLRLHNISISDNGPYQCSFKDSEFRGEAVMNLSVTALGLETQIYIQVPSTGGLTLECNSGGWFPQPQMEWRDNKGEVVPHLSKSYSQDEAGLFYVKMIVFLQNKSQGNVICYIHNPLSGEGKQINVFLAVSLSDPLFFLYNDWIQDISKMVIVLMTFYSVLILSLYLTIKGHIRRKRIFEKNRQIREQQNVEMETLHEK